MTEQKVNDLSFAFHDLQYEIWLLVLKNDQHIDEIYRCLWCNEPYGNKKCPSLMGLMGLFIIKATCGHYGIGYSCGSDIRDNSNNNKHCQAACGPCLGYDNSRRCFSCRTEPRASCVDAIVSLKFLIAGLEYLEKISDGFIKV